MYKRRRRAKAAFQSDAMLVSPDTMTKGGDPHVFSFLICAFVHSKWKEKVKSLADAKMLFHRKLCLIQIFFSSTWATSIFHFKWVLPFPVKIYPFEIFTRATPGSSLVNLYMSLWFWAKDAAEPRWLHWPLHCWLLLKLEPKEVVTMFCFFYLCLPLWATPGSSLCKNKDRVKFGAQKLDEFFF